MRKSYINGLVVIIFSAVLAASCERVETPLEEGVTDELIRVEAQGSDMQTRGLLNSTDLKKAGTTVKVYDYLTGFTGKMTVGQTTYDGTTTPVNVMYIDDAVTLGTDGGEDWSFSQFDWRWTRTGTHHFYGWLTHDANSNPALTSPFAESFDPLTRKLTVDEFTFTSATPQFDFSYSDIVTKTTPETVYIPLNHLFTALKVQVKNLIPEAINDVSVTFGDIINGRSATVDFSATPSTACTTKVKATYTVGATATFSLADARTSFPAAPAPTPETPEPEVTPVAVYTDNDGYRLLWPQDNLGKVTTATETEPVKPASTATVSFRIGSDTYVNTLTGSLENIFPDNKMEAGKKYLLTIIISSTDIRFRVLVDPLEEYYNGRDDDADNTNDYPDYLIKL